jgi:nucleoside-specific outer membrane channel protein Tsx
MDGDMKKISIALRKPLLGAAVFCCFSEFSHAEVFTAPSESAPPQTQQTQQTQKAPQTQPPQQAPLTPSNKVAPLSAPDLKSSEQIGAPPVTWNDTYIGYRYGSNFRYPGVPDKVAQNIGYLTTTGGFKWGSYAFNVDYLISNSANPEAGGPSSGGAQEVYSVGRVELSAGKILGHPVGFGIIRDVGLTGGYEFGVKNDAYGERARMLVLGPTIEFALPRGFMNLTAGLRTESNHNGITGVDVRFNTAWHVESSWLFPFRVGPVPLMFRGFASVTGPKGKDGFGVQTTTEFLTRVSLLADLGSFAGHPRTVYAGVGYEYWHNMYGTPSRETVSTVTSAPMVMAEFHF